MDVWEEAIEADMATDTEEVLQPRVEGLVHHFRRFPTRKRTRTSDAAEHGVVGHDTLELDPQGSKEWMAQLLHQRQTQTLTDIEFHASGQVLAAHRCVVAAHSPPMLAMFTNGMAESGSGVAQLNDTDPVLFSLLLDYMYGMSVAVPAGRLVPLLALASKWQVSSLVNRCGDALRSCLTEESCWDVAIASDACHSEDIRARALAFISARFLSLCKEPGFLKVSAGLLESLISGNTLWRFDEKDIYDAAISWLEAEPTRLAHAGEVLQHIRFPLIDPAYLVGIVKVHPAMAQPATQQLYQDATEHLALVLGGHRSLDMLVRRCSCAESEVLHSEPTDGTVYSLTCSPGHLFAGFEHGAIRVWDTNTWEGMVVPAAHGSMVGALLVLSSGLLASGSNDHAVKIWKPQDMSCVRLLDGRHRQGVWCLAEYGSYLISACYDGSIVFWDMESWQCTSCINNAHSDAIEKILVWGSYLISTGDDHLIKVWDLETHDLAAQLDDGASEAKMNLALVGDKLVSISLDGGIAVFQTGTWKHLQDLPKYHEAGLRALVPIGSRKMLSGSLDKIVVWDTNSWVKEYEFSLGAQDEELEVLSAMGPHVISGSASGLIKLWHLS